MSYFPLFIDLSTKRILIVGAGIVATRKLEKLNPFAPKLKVVAKEFCPDFENELSLCLKEPEVFRREFLVTDIEGIDIVIVAADDLSLQKQIFDICSKRNIPCNSVDSPAFCSFIFPSLILRGDMTIGLTTGGKAPGLTVQIRKRLEAVLPEDLESIIKTVSSFREKQKVSGPSTFIERAQQVSQLVQILLTKRDGEKKTWNHEEETKID